MNTRAFAALVGNEVRLRVRRVSTLVVLALTLVIGWSVVADPASGRSLVVIDRARAVYDSTTLAIGSAGLGALLFGLMGFYLARGRTREDLTCGVGPVLAATPVGNALFTLSRWAGAVIYLSVLALGLAAAMLARQWLAGEAPLAPFTFLAMYALLLLPTLMFAAAVAVLCDAVPSLMGKRGDVLYFFLWMAQFAALPAEAAAAARAGAGVGLLAAIDVSGLTLTMGRLRELFATTHLAMGGVSYDRALAPIVITGFWTPWLVVLRLGSMAVSFLPLVLAAAWFHRYSPDRVKPRLGARRSLLATVNGWMAPLARPVAALLSASARIPGIAGTSLADAAIALMAQPLLVAALLVLNAAALLLPASALPGLLFLATATWGIVIADLTARDHQAGTRALAAAVPGGAVRRHASLLLAALWLATAFAGVIALRWTASNPAGALAAFAMASGFAGLAGIAGALGLLLKSGRAFLALFLFGLYIGLQAKSVNWLDWVGSHGSADAASMAMLASLGAASFMLGLAHARCRGGG